MGKKGPLWWRESDWLLRGSSAANQILLRHSGPILSCASVRHLVDQIKFRWPRLNAISEIALLSSIFSFEQNLWRIVSQ